MRRLFLLVVLLAGCGGVTADSTPTPDPFASFIETRNDCGTCGTDAPVGGWENVGGDAMLINADGSFVIAMADASSFGGDWELSGDELCFYPDTGADMCFAYAQKVDAMTLDGAIFVRR